MFRRKDMVLREAYELLRLGLLYLRIVLILVVNFLSRDVERVYSLRGEGEALESPRLRRTILTPMLLTLPLCDSYFLSVLYL